MSRVADAIAEMKAIEAHDQRIEERRMELLESDVVRAAVEWVRMRRAPRPAIPLSPAFDPDLDDERTALRAIHDPAVELIDAGWE